MVKNKYLVTGGAGFIGSNLVDRLIEEDNEVVVIDDESSISSTKFYWNKKAENYKVNILDYENTKDLYHGVDVVFHMAADSRVQTGIENPTYAIENNILGTHNVLKCSKEANVKRVVYSSTSAIYGNKSVPNIESQRDDCLNPYSVSKFAGEKICSMYTNLYGLDTVIFRYFNVYGDRQPTKGSYASVIGIFSEKLKLGLPLTISGDGTQKRDFINVADVVNANILAATVNINNSYFGSPINIGYGKSYSINELASMISDKIEYIPKKDGESKETLANIERARGILGWYPKIDLESWIKENIK